MAAPLCYLYSKPEEAYFVFRQLYTRYFCKLHLISSDPQSLIGLCKMFEDLLQQREPQMYYHLLQLKIQPLRIAFNWICFAFSGFLNSNELLLLWDRILGFDNLYLIPVLAAAIFSFRSKFVLKSTSDQEIYVSICAT